MVSSSITSSPVRASGDPTPFASRYTMLFGRFSGARATVVKKMTSSAPVFAIAIEASEVLGRALLKAVVAGIGACQAPPENWWYVPLARMTMRREPSVVSLATRMLVGGGPLLPGHAAERGTRLHAPAAGKVR